MISVLFVCHGNICRSPISEFVMKDMVTKRGIKAKFYIASAATSTEEIWNGIGNPVYPPAKRELAKSFELKLREKDISSAVDTVAKTDAAPTRISNFNRLFPLNYGHLALKPLWEKDLGLKYKIEYLQKSSTEIKTWRLNDLLFYLCALKLIDPKSYFSASNSKSNFLYCPWNNVVQDNFYRALDFVYDHRESLIKHAVKSRLEQTKGQIKVAFFDCTNTWFETPYDDITWQVIR